MKLQPERDMNSHYRISEVLSCRSVGVRSAPSWLAAPHLVIVFQKPAVDRCGKTTVSLRLEVRTGGSLAVCSSAGPAFPAGRRRDPLCVRGGSDHPQVIGQGDPSLPSPHDPCCALAGGGRGHRGRDHRARRLRRAAGRLPSVRQVPRPRGHHAASPGCCDEDELTPCCWSSCSRPARSSTARSKRRTPTSDFSAARCSRRYVSWNRRFDSQVRLTPAAWQYLSHRWMNSCRIMARAQWGMRPPAVKR